MIPSDLPPGVSESDLAPDEPLEWDDYYTEIAMGDGEPYRLDTAREVQDWLSMLDGMRQSAAEIHGHEMAPDAGISRLWSIVEGDEEDDDGTPILYALAGFHRVNVIYYVVSTEPVRPEHQDVEFLY